MVFDPDTQFASYRWTDKDCRFWFSLYTKIRILPVYDFFCELILNFSVSLLNNSVIYNKTEEQEQAEKNTRYSTYDNAR